MSDRAEPPIPRSAVVTDNRLLTPNMRRIALGGAGLRGFAPAPGAWGPYAKLLIPRAGEPPARRTYSVRAFDAHAGALTVDVVMHEPRGVASSWAASAEPGDAVGVLGPGAVPVAVSTDGLVDGEGPRVILAGDHSALPAIAFTLERLAADARGQAFVALGDRADRQRLATPPGVELCWVDAAVSLDAAVMGADWPRDGAVTFWAGAEAALARRLRAHARGDRRLGPERCAVLNYWKRGKPEGAFAYVE